MKIHRINSNYSFCNFKSNVPGKQEDNHESDNENGINGKITIDPAVMAMFQNLTSYSVLENEKGEKYIKKGDLQIEPEFVREYLTDKNGKINKGNVMSFIRLYEDKMSAFDDENSRERANMERMAAGDFEIVKSTYGKEYYDLLRERAKAFAAEMIERIDASHEKTREVAYVRTKLLFGLSKTNDGYDFSDIKEKDWLLNLIERENREKKVSINCADFFDAIRRSDGSCDAKFGAVFLDIYKDLDKECDPKIVSDHVRSWLESDPEHERSILSTVGRLQNSPFTWSTSGSSNPLAELMDCLFDEDGKYDVEKEKSLMSDVRDAEYFLNESIDDTNSKEYKIYAQIELEKLLDEYGN